MEDYGKVKQEIIELLKKGTPTSEIVRRYNIPQSTVSTWLCNLRKQQFVPSTVTATISAKNNAELINSAEIKIVSSISKIVSSDISDREWIEVQKSITRELQAIAFKIESENSPKKEESGNLKKIREITEKWNNNPMIKKYEIQ